MSKLTESLKLNDASQQREDWHEQFLQRIMTIAAILSVLPVLIGFFGSTSLFQQVIYIGAFLALVSTIVLRLPYRVKAGIFVFLPLLLGVSSTITAGTHGDNIFFFLTFVVLSALFIGVRSSLFAITISEIILIATGALVVYERMTLLNPLASKGSLQDWAADSMLLLLASSIVIVSVQMLQDRLEKAQEQNKVMSEEAQEIRDELGVRVAEQTSALAHKTKQLNAALFTVHEAAVIQDLDILLSQTVHLISEQFGCYHVGIYLMNQRGDYVALQAASSEGGKKLLENGYRLRVGVAGMIGFVAAEKKARISLDVEKDTMFLNTPELSETQSELSLPLIVRDKVIGVLDMQASDVDTFSYEDLDIYQTMADQIAITIENTRLHSESQLIISQLETISNENTRQNWETELATKIPRFHYSAVGVRAAEEAAALKGKNILDIPITLRGQKIGKISLQRKSEFHKWTTQEENVAREVAAQAALALENIRLVESTRQRAGREQAIAGISARVRETLDLDTVLRITAREIQQALNLQEAEVRLLPPDKPGSEKRLEQAGSL